MSRGSRASLPAANYKRAAREVSFRGVEVFGEDGTLLGSFSFDVPGCSDKLKQQLADAFAGATDQGGRWRRKSTCTTSNVMIRGLLRHLAALANPPKSMEHVTGEHLLSFSMTRRNGTRESIIRVLRPLLAEHPDVREDARDFLLRRISRADYLFKETSYSDESMLIIRAAAERTLAKAHRRIMTNTRALTDAGVSTIPPEMPRRLLEHVAQFGDITRTAGGNSREPALVASLGGLRPVVTSLFPSFVEMGAAAVLMVCLQGWNASVIEDLRVPDESPNRANGHVPIHTMHLTKPRLGPGNHHMTNSLLDLGEGTAGNLISRIISMTAQARVTMSSLGLSTDKLLLARRDKSNSANGTFWAEGLPRHTVSEWAESVSLRDEAGNPLRVTMRRLRRTVVVAGGKPLQHSEETHEAVYAGRDGRLRSESAGVIEQGINDALEHAQTRMSMVLGVGQDVNTLASAAKITREKAAQVIAGTLDTATAACMDFEHSPHSNSGPCDVSFLVCLACPLAIVTDRHLPRLVLLHDHLSELRSAVSEEIWKLDWRTTWERVQDLLQRHTTAAERDQARAVCTDKDRQLISDLLDRRLDP